MRGLGNAVSFPIEIRETTFSRFTDFMESLTVMRTNLCNNNLDRDDASLLDDMEDIYEQITKHGYVQTSKKAVSGYF